MISDKELGLDRPITRRQFCQGTAVALGASLLPWAQVPAFDGSPELGGAYYPPALSGLRGDHVGSFETAHALARRGRRWESGVDTGEGPFDLAVVGAGISGLSANEFATTRSACPASRSRRSWCNPRYPIYRSSRPESRPSRRPRSRSPCRRSRSASRRPRGNACIHGRRRAR